MDIPWRRVSDAAAATWKLGRDRRAPQVPALPDGRHWIVTPLHVTCDDQEISFEAGAVVEAKRGAYHGLGDHLFHLDSVRNVSLVGYGATLKMWRQDYNDPSLYAHSEGRHAIAVLGAQDVSIRGLVVSESGGDGV